MIDTVELRIKVNATNIKCLLKAINNTIEKNKVQYSIGFRVKCSQVMHRVKRKSAFPLVTTGLFMLGWQELKIERLGYVNNGQAFYHYNIIVVYKPALVIHSDDYYALSCLADYDAAKSNFDNVVELLNEELSLVDCDFSLPQFEEWSVSRIDYATQICTIEYLSFWYIFKNYWQSYSPNVYLYRESATVNFYDKTYKKENGLNELEEHVIRFEIQCHKNWLNNSYSKGRLSGKDIQSLWNQTVAQNVIISKFYSLFGVGDFYIFDDAVKIIRQNFSDKKAEILISFLRYTQFLTVDEAVECLAEQLHTTKQKVRRNYLRELNQKRIAYICLPDSYDWAYALMEDVGINISPNIIKYNNENVVRRIANPANMILK